jgi:hypothetical protein
MPSSDDLADTCRHDRAPLMRIGKLVRAGRAAYILMCPVCGFMVSTDELRRLRAARASGGGGRPHTRSLPRAIGL